MRPTKRTAMIPRIPLTRNQADQSKWWGRHRQTKLWRTEILVAFGRRAVPPKKAHVDITVYRGKSQDPDNLVASMKPILDALVKCGWLTDDNDAGVVLSVREVPYTKLQDRRTIIEWEAADGA